MSQDLVLYSYYRSSTSYRVRIALHLKGLSFDYQPIHLVRDGGHQHASEYKDLNPMGEVPTLVHKGKPIAQSMAIIEYLDSVFPEMPLFPKDPYTCARVRQFCENINAGIHPITNLKVLQYLDSRLLINPEQKKEWLQHWIKKGLEACETLIKNTSGQYSFADEITAADTFLVPQVFSAQRFGITDFSEYPSVERVNKNCLKLPAFHAAHPSHQIDFENSPNK